jgi:hypothetical protein
VRPWVEARQGRPSFLKKRSKKLLLIARGHCITQVNSVLPETDKSFLVLLFKKEHFLSCMWSEAVIRSMLVQ